MKTALLILLLPLACLAQHPLVTGAGIDWTRASASILDYTANLYIDYESDTTNSLKNYGNGNIVTTWTNIAPGFELVSSFYLQTSSGVWPFYTNNVTQTGKPAVDFSGNNNTLGANIPHWSTSGSNQPNTIIAVIRLLSPSSSQVVQDTSIGGRVISALANTPTMNINAGNGTALPVSVFPTAFAVYAWCYTNGGSYCRTNGVLVGGANAGVNAMGNLIMGNDQTGVTAFKSQIAAFRIYNESMSTNNLHIAEQNLASRYTGATLPSP